MPNRTHLGHVRIGRLPASVAGREDAVAPAMAGVEGETTMSAAPVG
ncbi:MAG TPA: hypothetical protein VMG62_03075 [Solirubrobacteraceae bacterium]|nr:hypothetical protein [Solirubrobacteraceae bacterium]